MIDLDLTLHLSLTLLQAAVLVATWSGVGLAWRDLGRTVLQGRRLTLQRRQKSLLLPAPREVRRLK